MSLEYALRLVRERFSQEQRNRLKRYLANHWRGPQHALFRLLAGSDLGALALVYGSDKNTKHRYTQHYERHLAAWRRRSIALLEIGVGGYEDPAAGGASLRMWRTYFPKARIYGIDVVDKKPHDERRIRTFQGAQGDPVFLATVVAATGPLDVVIDDGSHRCSDVIASFEFLFPRMSPRAVYAIEDTQTSYWEEYGGDDREPDRPETTVGYFKRLVHGLNHSERRSSAAAASELDRSVVAISFYHNLIVVERGLNEGQPVS